MSSRRPRNADRRPAPRFPFRTHVPFRSCPQLPQRRPNRMAPARHDALPSKEERNAIVAVHDDVSPAEDAVRSLECEGFGDLTRVRQIPRSRSTQPITARITVSCGHRGVQSWTGSRS